MMNKAELRELAEWGVRRKLESIERQLAVLYDEFPNVFIGDAAPVFVRAETRESGNGWKPEMQDTLKRTPAGAAISATWTPERRARASRLMKKRLRERGGSLRNPAPQKIRAKKANGQRNGRRKLKPGGWKNRWYDRLEAMGGVENVGDSAKALKTTSAVLITSGNSWLKDGIIVKKGVGVYGIGKPKPVEA
jgi:hypothetical protein